jgi:hypothetical protein
MKQLMRVFKREKPNSKIETKNTTIRWSIIEAFLIASLILYIWLLIRENN